MLYTWLHVTEIFTDYISILQLCNYGGIYLFSYIDFGFWHCDATAVDISISLTKAFLLLLSVLSEHDICGKLTGVHPF